MDQSTAGQGLPKEVLDKIFFWTASITTEKHDTNIIQKIGPDSRYFADKALFLAKPNEKMPFLKHKLARMDEYAWQFFSAFVAKVTLSFRERETLERFVRDVRRLTYRSGIDTPATITIQLEIFADPVMVENLSKWEGVYDRHGTEVGARKHFREWIDVVQQLMGLPLAVNLIISLNAPFRDYKSLRKIMSPFHIWANSIEVEVAEEAWANVPSKEFHFSLTKFFITGKRPNNFYRKMEDYLNEPTTDWLYVFGNRGYKPKNLKALVRKERAQALEIGQRP